MIPVVLHILIAAQ